MNNKRNLTIAIILMLLFIGLALCARAEAVDYYSSPTGSGVICSSGTPCSLATGLTKLVSGSTDTLYLKDGTYTGNITVPVSGDASHYITIKAVNDGMAIIDANNASTRAFDSNGKSYINVEGIIFKNSTTDVVRVSGASTYINFRRVSGRSSGATGNNGLFQVYGTSPNHILFEDCLAYGRGRVGFSSYGASYITVRRCYARMSTNPYGEGIGITMYNSSNGLVENSIVTVSSSPTYNYHGIGAWATDGGISSNNSYYGNVVYGVNDDCYYSYVGDNGGGIINTGNFFSNNVCISPTLYAFQNHDSTTTTVQNSTVVSATWSSGAHWMDTGSLTFKDNSVINASYGFKLVGGTLAHTYNNYYNMTHAPTIFDGLTGDTTEFCNDSTGGCTSNGINPVYDTATYGNGAYLMVPTALQGQGESGGDIGAKVLYRYVDGVLTTTPLWPWPMEDRIYAETGYSPTYSAHGGIWTTLANLYPVTTPIVSGVGTLHYCSDCSPYFHLGELSQDVNTKKFYKGIGTGLEEIGAGGGMVYPESGIVTSLGTAFGPSYSIATLKTALDLSNTNTGDNAANSSSLPTTYLDTDGTLNANSDSKIASQKAVKTYTDNVAQGLSAKPSAIVATITTLPSYIYNNGTLGVGATITGVATGTLTIDSHLVALNDYILVKNETTTSQPYNGLYKCTLAGATGVAFILTRDTSMDQTGEFSGAYVFIESGSTYTGAGFVSTTTGAVTVGSTNVNFTQFNATPTNITGTAGNLSGTPALPNGTTATTQSAGDNSTKLATTAYVDALKNSPQLNVQGTACGLISSASDQTTAIRACFAYAKAQSIRNIYIPSGSYICTPTSTDPCVTLDWTVYIHGDGNQSSLLKTPTGTNSWFNATANYGAIEKIGFFNTDGSTPTSGAAITLNNPTNVSSCPDCRMGWVIRDNWLQGFYYGIYNANSWWNHIEDNFFYENIKYHYYNTAGSGNYDAGDNFITGNYFLSNASTPSANIRWEAGGGFYVSGNKMWGNALIGLDAEVNDSVTTVDLKFTENSVELGTSTNLIRLARNGTTGSVIGAWINNNQFKEPSAVAAIYVGAGWTVGTINDNLFSGTLSAGGKAVQIYAGANFEINGNVITNENVGVQFDSGASNCKAEANLFYNVVTPCSNSSSTSITILAPMKEDAGYFNALTSKTTPVAADLLAIEDSAASYAKAKISLSSLGDGLFSSFGVNHSPLYAMDVYPANANNIGLHVGPSAGADTGTYLMSYTGAGAYVIADAIYFPAAQCIANGNPYACCTGAGVGATCGWIAKSTTPSILNFSGTGIYWNLNTGASAGAAFTPSTQFTLAGKLTIPVVYSNTGGTANVSVASNGDITRITSAKKYKFNILPFIHGMDYLAKINPKRYTEKSTGFKKYGLIADELGSIDKKLAIYDNGQIEDYDTRAVIAVMVNAIKQLNAKIEKLESQCGK